MVNERGPEKKTLTPHEVAAATGFGIKATYKLLKENRIPHIRSGKRFYVPRVALDKWLESFADTIPGQ